MNRYFKKIEEFEDYFISKNGKIFSIKSNKYIKHNNKYVVLWNNNKKHIRSVNKLIKQSFESEISDILIDKEKFRPIPGFEKEYLIDKSGNIYSNHKNEIRKGFINPSGYSCVFLFKNGKVFNKLVHRLVYETWNGKIDDGITVDHIDEDKTNNESENLQTLTRSENVLKFHSLRKVERNIEGFKKIENFENYYINKNGEVISFKYDDNFTIIYNDGKNGVYLRKNNKRYYVNVNNLLYKYFGIEKVQKNRKYKN